MTEKNLTKKIALITGANKGLGFAAARQLGAMGYRVLVGARDRSKGEQAAAKLVEEGLDACFVSLDVNNPESIQMLAALIAEQYTSLDVLINNAGVCLDNATPTELSVGRLRETFETNIFGVFAVTQELLPLLRRSTAGRIVNLSSSLGSLSLSSDPSFELAEFKMIAYNASKAALNALTVHLAYDLRNTSIKVNSADPGYSATDMTNHQSNRSAEEGATVVVKLATLKEDGPTGGFFDERGSVPW